MCAWGYRADVFIWGIIWSAIEIGLIIVAIYFIISSFRGTRNRSHKSDALEILKERYVRGEISEEEYLERKKKYLKKNNYIIIFTPAHLSSLILHLLVLRRLL
ncbi:MAG: SHOCT domain-containing protein [Thermoanaerobacter sp.]|uniref:SHOCT domain-containing protein n=1 Tax=unclassified Thermoanaerobacter TaxID=2636821 RepID=UPI001E2F1319|nr:SHOCT domain-containing protein [Thermoanaerobacter sp. X514]